MLHAQLGYYMKGHYMKLDPHTLSLESMLINGYSARNIMEFYTMLEPSAQTHYQVLEALAAKDSTVVLVDGGIQLLSLA